MNSKIWIVVGKFVILLLLVSCSDTPNILITLEPPLTATPVEMASWVTHPKARTGQELFIENCADCHGELGAGDGPLALSQQIPAPGNFRLGDQQVLTPQEWFETISYGRLERLMPPWTSINARDRWELAWYSYTLSYSEDLLNRGASLWFDQCSSCHVRDNDEAGKKINTTLNGSFRFQDLDYMSQISDVQLEEMIRYTHSEIIFNNAFDDRDLKSLTQFIRAESLGGFNYWAEADIPLPLETTRIDLPVSVPVDSSLSETDIQLIATFEGKMRDSWQAAAINRDRFAFFEIPIVEHWLYQARASNENVEFRSLKFTSDQLQEIRNLPVYAVTNGIRDLKQISLAIQLYPIESEEFGDFFQVTHAFRLTNASNSLYSESAFKAWQVPLPKSTSLVELGATSRHRLDSETSEIYGMQPVLPGAGEVVGLQYILPRSLLAVYDFHLPYGLQGALRILVPTEGWKLLGLDINMLEEEEINDRPYKVYGLDVQLEPGHVLRFGVVEED